jgi:hypothetical protein
MRETGGQILPRFAQSGTYCREAPPFGIRKPLIYRAFDRGTALARTSPRSGKPHRAACFGV